MLHDCRLLQLNWLLRYKLLIKKFGEFFLDWLQIIQFKRIRSKHQEPLLFFRQLTVNIIFEHLCFYIDLNVLIRAYCKGKSHLIKVDVCRVGFSWRWLLLEQSCFDGVLASLFGDDEPIGKEIFFVFLIVGNFGLWEEELFLLHLELAVDQCATVIPLGNCRRCGLAEWSFWSNSESQRQPYR